MSAWIRDLGFGLRFAFIGRDGWIRTLLTALGTGLAVALLLLAAAVPGLVHDRAARSAARELVYYGPTLPPAAAPNTELIAYDYTTYRGADVNGILIKSEGPKAPVPPGLTSIPGDNEMVVSPALARLLASPKGALLRPRLPYRIVGTLGEAGLNGPQDLAFFAGDTSLSANEGIVDRIDSVGQPISGLPTTPLLTMLSVLGFVLLLVPVAVFLAAAVRFGGERRDQRLAALRLLGSDIRGTHRVAAGEALAGALLGSLAGYGLFALGRHLAGLVQISGVSVFPSDINPGLGMTVLILVAMPVAALTVTSVALRNVSVEPLGVVHRSARGRRRLWWRLVPPTAGLALLWPSVSTGLGSGTHQAMLAAGAALILVGLALVLPWGLDRAVSGLGGGPLPLHLGSRRLQFSSGGPARAVSGVTVAVAAAIAAQALFSGADSELIVPNGPPHATAQAVVGSDLTSPTEADQLDGSLRATSGVRQVTTVVSGYAIINVPTSVPPQETTQVGITIGDCAELSQEATITDCRPGSIYRIPGAGTVAGKVLNFDVPDMYGQVYGPPKLWTVPTTIQLAQSRLDAGGISSIGIYATPQALPVSMLAQPFVSSLVQFEPGAGPDTIEYVRNTAAAVDPLMNVEAPFTAVDTAPKLYLNIRRGMIIGAFATLLMIALSLAIGTVEQLRERRKLLSVLVAFGTRRSTLVLSVLWQSAVPIAFGMAMAMVSGLGLGAILLRIVRAPITFDWPTVVAFIGAGAAAILVTTVVSLPSLWRMMRPEGLRTE